MFSICYYISYKNALKQFNEKAVEQNGKFIASIENNETLQNKKEQVAQNTVVNAQTQETSDSIESNTEELDSTDTSDSSIAVDTMKEVIILPSTQYTLQTYDIKNGNMKEEVLPTPSYLVGLTRKQVIEYLSDYMKDLTWSEYEKGLTSFELMYYSQDKVILRKTYNIDMVENKYYLKSQNGYIVVYYGDMKTVYDYTSVSVDGLSQYDQLKLQEGIYVKDLDELYAVLENYSS
jgi:hypothetical protein